MGFKLPGFNFFKGKGGKDTVSGQATIFGLYPDLMKQDLQQKADGDSEHALPLIGHKPLKTQLWTLLIAWAVSLIFSSAPVVWYGMNQYILKQHIRSSSEIQMLSQRIANSAQQAAQGNPAAIPQLRESEQRLITEMATLIQGSGVSASPAAVQPVLKEMNTQWGEMRRGIGQILSTEKNLQETRNVQQLLFEDSDKMLKMSRQLTEAYNDNTSSGLPEAILFFIGACLAMTFATLFAMLLLGEAKRRAAESERENKRNQQAILQLLDEMGDLADGDLTVRAQVTEDITGAIADSINYAIDELRTLVEGVNKATEQLTQSSGEAQLTSERLLKASEKQTREIQETSTAVLQMADSISKVSANAAESAKVAQQSLQAADKGAKAVQNSIAGMGEIRGQIQETAKRIKRLGESSQEISEIVGLISDITEQTNILALNAAIQAASAGEAGRGFTVVAEEVQRLAERSGEATKQIGAIVKTIQTDTHDAVAAMEQSTQGVVEGARLSDAAGQALSEIERVSRELAELIETISKVTQAQTEAAGMVARNMRDIQDITNQTADGTKQTATSVGRLSALATELRGSVAGFKLS